MILKQIGSAALAGAVSFFLLANEASAQSVTITVDENGNGSISSSGFSASLPFALQADPGPGGLASVLTYSLLNPPDLTAGDVILLDPNSLPSDVVRFNPDEVCPDGSTGCLVFYSNPLDGIDSLADTPAAPGDFYANTIFLPEIGGGAIYTPLAGEPGFVPGFLVTYDIISDVPEPASLVILGSGLAGLALMRRRGRRKLSR